MTTFFYLSFQRKNFKIFTLYLILLSSDFLFFSKTTQKWARSLQICMYRIIISMCVLFQTFIEWNPASGCSFENTSIWLCLTLIETIHKGPLIHCVPGVSGLSKSSKYYECPDTPGTQCIKTVFVRKYLLNYFGKTKFTFFGQLK